MKNKKLVLFDLDGTLVKGGNPVARKSVVVAMKKVFGVKVIIDWSKHDGSTDPKIMADVLAEKGIRREKTYSKIDKLAKARLDYFASHVASDYKKNLIPEAVELVKKLKSKKIFVGLLTGNFSQIGWYKLKLVRIDKLFDFGLFGEMAEDRNSLAKLVFKKAKKHFSIDFSKEFVFIIGDTPYDIKCGKAAGVKTIGVTTGSFSRAELKNAGADLAVDSLADKRVISYIIEDR